MSGTSDDQKPNGPRVKLDATGEFFSVGPPLHAVRSGYVRRSADNTLYEIIRSGQFAHVIAPERSGKTSLIAATAARLQHNGYKVAVLDLQQIGVRDAGTDAGRWYYNVAYRLLRQLRVRVDLQTWWQDKSILANRQRLLEFYSEIILQNVQERVVVFIDEIQCIDDLPFADQLLASIRAAHNARATDPEFSRLTFVLLGECDPPRLIDEAELSPFNVTQAVALNDFTREELDLFHSELNLPAEASATALDRIYYWTSGQPYLSQKLARSLSREPGDDDIAAEVDRIALQQLGGRTALHNEPHMSHIHRAVLRDAKQREAQLNLYGRIAKNIKVPTDLGSPAQRRLIALGLLLIDEEGQLKIRNRLYQSVFTARWANENLPNHWRAPASVAAALLLMLALPFWYTQVLPRSYVDVLTAETTELATLQGTYESLRSFPGHADSADHLYRIALEDRAERAVAVSEIETIATMAASLPNAGTMPAGLAARYWDRQGLRAMRNEQRDRALLATIQSLVLSSPKRRTRAATLVAEDYPLLISALPAAATDMTVFDAQSLLLTSTRGAQVSQWSLGSQGLERRDDWTITALEVSPLVRRVIVDREETLRRVGLSLNLSHARVADLRIKIIAPSGRAVEIDPGVSRALANEEIRIDPAQLRVLQGEPMNGTWSLSVRDEALGVAGQLVGWNLSLNSQGMVEDFQRGLNISDPVERETTNIWFGRAGRFAIARATQSDSARIWDLAFAKPVRAIAVNELEKLIGISAGARQLVTATQDTVNLWDTSTGHRVATLPVGAASGTSTLTADREHLLVQQRGDQLTRFELWSLADARVATTLELAGTPALASLDSSGSRLAVADYDRAIRVWDMRSGALVTQIDLPAQPSKLYLVAGGDVLGVVFGEEGAALWRIDQPSSPVFEVLSEGRWQLAFSASGSKALLGRPAQGFHVFDTHTGRRIGPAIGAGASPLREGLLGFSADEQAVVTAGPNGGVRFWRAPTTTPAQALGEQRDSVWPPAGDAIAVATPGGDRIIVGDRAGDVHVVAPERGPEAFLAREDGISFLGHSQPIRLLAASPAGDKAVSVAADNSVRVWNTATGLPQPFFAHVAGNPVHRVALSPDSSLVGILSSNRVQVMDSSDGSVKATFELAEAHRSMAFATSSRLYLGSEKGALRMLERESGGNWQLQTLWQGDRAIRWLQSSPQSQFLTFVDQDNVAQQFILADGKLGDNAVRLPGELEDLAYSPSGSRVLFRTSRWIHRASAGPKGLVWLDTLFAPHAVRGSRMLFGDRENGTASPLGNRVLLPVSDDGFVRLAELHFDASSGPSLFGNKDDLLKEWRYRLGVD